VNFQNNTAIGQPDIPAQLRRCTAIAKERLFTSCLSIPNLSKPFSRNYFMAACVVRFAKAWNNALQWCITML